MTPESPIFSLKEKGDGIISENRCSVLKLRITQQGKNSHIYTSPEYFRVGIHCIPMKMATPEMEIRMLGE
jgi:hypothetical protein